jgi:nicotinamidase-related amidase
VATDGPPSRRLARRQLELQTVTSSESISNWTLSTDSYITPEMARSALVIIDTQVDFVDGGSSPIEGTTAVLPNIVRLLEAFRTAGLPIVHIVRLYDGDEVDLVRRSALKSGARMARPGTPGSQIAPELRPEGSDELDAVRLLAGESQRLGPGEVAIWKPRWSAFFRTGLNEHLQQLGVSTVVFAGCNFPNCPRASIYDASELDYRVLITSDAISQLSEHHLEELELLGVVHASSATIIDHLARS